MESKIAEAISLKYNPVAVIWTDKKPENTLQFKKGGQGCVMSMLASAAKGRTAVFDRETFGCPGGGVGLGFGNQYLNFPGGIDCFYGFLFAGRIMESFERIAATEYLTSLRSWKKCRLNRAGTRCLPWKDSPLESAFMALFAASQKKSAAGAVKESRLGNYYGKHRTK